MGSPGRVFGDFVPQPFRAGLTEDPPATLDQEEGVMEETKSPRDLAGLYLSCYDMLFAEDGAWLVRVTEAPSFAPAGPYKEPEQCPVVGNQVLGVAAGLEGQSEECSLEQVQSMVVGEVLKDIETACKLLNISPDPMEWNVTNVQKWVLWTEHLYKLPPVGKAFQDLRGKDLCAMSEEDFRKCSLQGGDVLHAHLDIWKSAWMQERSSPDESSFTEADQWSEADSFCTGQPIHLWQFLRELLLRPHSYGRSIRWLNKEKGIFKIEDSAHVARLWGLRKNRPAMNYDKLSRSIRQYYKKGIIRKPAISQRLVYQFVHPV